MKPLQIRRDEGRAFLNWIKLGIGCMDCGYRAHAVALDFDHVRGEKNGTISQMIAYFWDDIQEEMQKCEIRCANCHRVKTHERKES